MDTTSPTAKRKKRFLANFAKLGNITYAAKAAGIDRTCHYDWLEKDEKYAERFHSAQEEAADLLEAEVLRRGVKGVVEPVYYKGEICGRVRKYSDVLLIFLLKGVRPNKFRDRVEVSDPSGRNPLTAALEDMWTKIEAGGGNGKGGSTLEGHAAPGNGVPVKALVPLPGNPETLAPTSVIDVEALEAIDVPRKGEAVSLRPSRMVKDEDGE